MKITVAKHNKDQYIIIETEGKTVTYKAKMLMKTSERAFANAKNSEDYVYESEVYEATFLREESNKEKTKPRLYYADQDTIMPAT